MNNTTSLLLDVRPSDHNRVASVRSLYSSESEVALDYSETGSLEWIHKVHIPYMRLYYEEKRGELKADDRSVLAHLSMLSRPSSCMTLSKLVKELIITSLVNDICNPVSVSGTPQDEERSHIQKRCIQFHESMLCYIVELRICDSHSLANLDCGAPSELFRYCYRRVLLLVGSKDLSDHIATQALSALVLARHLIINRTSAPISLTRCIFDDCDFLLLLVQLVEEAPWTKNGFKFNGNSWTSSTEEVCLPEGNVWLSIWSLIMSDEVRTGSYDISRSHRMGSILSLRRHLTQEIVDQIPVLDELKAFIEHLNFSNQVSTSNRYFSATNQSSLIVDIAETSVYDEYRNVPFKLKGYSDPFELQAVCKLLDQAYEEMGLFDSI